MLQIFIPIFMETQKVLLESNKPLRMEKLKYGNSWKVMVGNFKTRKILNLCQLASLEDKLAHLNKITEMYHDEVKNT